LSRYKCGIVVSQPIKPGSDLPIPVIPNPLDFLIPSLVLILILCLPVSLFMGFRWVIDKGVQKTVIFMLDVSGSMGENDKNGKVKVEIARKKIMNLIKSHEYKDKKIGLVTFGGECNTLRCKILPDYRNQSHVIDHLNSSNCSNPNGSTPLAYAIREVTQILSQQNLTPAAKVVRQLDKFSKQPRVIPIIILFTDGFDTCDGDPIKEVRKAKEGGIDFITYIIGYSVNTINTNERELKQLPILAMIGGGRYISADTEQELEDRFNELNSDEGQGILKLEEPSNYQVEKWELYKGMKQPGNTNNTAYESRDKKNRSDKLWDSYLVGVGDYELHIFLKNTGSPLVKKVIIRKDQQTDVII
jgi:Mg-chelatase subunit ChlD